MQKLHRCASEEMLWLPPWLSIGWCFKIACTELPSPPTSSWVWAAMARGCFWDEGHTVTLCNPSATFIRTVVKHLCCRTNLVDTMFLLNRMTWKWMLKCLVNSNVSEFFYFLPLCKKTPSIAGLTRLAFITAREHLQGMYQRVPKHCRAFAQQSLGEIGWRWFEKSVCGAHGPS